MLLPATSLAASEPRLVLSSETLQLAVGQETVVKLLVENAAPAIKVQTRLTFDPASLQVVALTNGDFLTNSPETEAFVLANEFDNESGTLDYALLLKPGQPPAEGNGLVATVIFQAKTDGQATIEIQEGRFFSPAGAEIAALTENTQLIIGDEAAAEYVAVDQLQPLPEVAESSVANPPVVESMPPVEEQPIPEQMESATASPEEVAVSPAAPMIEPEPAAEVTEPATTGLRRFRVQPQFSINNDQLLALALLVGLGLLVLAASFMGMVGVGVGWFWWVRARRRRSRRSAPVQIIMPRRNYPISLSPVPVRRIK
jgi:hypothetical protein